MGCDASSFACLDDPNQTAPTLSSADLVRGVLNEQAPLGVIVHNSTFSDDRRGTDNRVVR